MKYLYVHRSPDRWFRWQVVKQTRAEIEVVGPVGCLRDVSFKQVIEAVGEFIQEPEWQPCEGKRSRYRVKQAHWKPVGYFMHPKELFYKEAGFNSRSTLSLVRKHNADIRKVRRREEEQWRKRWDAWDERQQRRRGSYLGVLGLQAGTSQKDIDAAYRRLALQHHPDRGGDAAEFHRLQEAYESAKSRTASAEDVLESILYGDDPEPLRPSWMSEPGTAAVTPTSTTQAEAPSRREYYREYNSRRAVKHGARKCDHCGVDFTPRRSTARYCSSKCRVYASRGKKK